MKKRTARAARICASCACCFRPIGRWPVVLFAIEVAHDLHVPAKVLRPRVQRGPELIPVPAEELDALYAGGRRRAAAEAHGSDWITLD